ncbi:MAG: hypothetical protein MI743_04150, partial [Sneathiellales bacterium]|nr:hypothetical protein [Sneathiellales bacterium]
GVVFATRRGLFFRSFDRQDRVNRLVDFRPRTRAPKRRGAKTPRRDGVVEVIQESRYPLRWIVVSSSGPWGKASGGAFAARPSLR